MTNSKPQQLGNRAQRALKQRAQPNNSDKLHLKFG